MSAVSTCRRYVSASTNSNTTSPRQASPPPLAIRDRTRLPTQDGKALVENSSFTFLANMGNLFYLPYRLCRPAFRTPPCGNRKDPSLLHSSGIPPREVLHIDGATFTWTFAIFFTLRTTLKG